MYYYMLRFKSVSTFCNTCCLFTITYKKSTPWIGRKHKHFFSIFTRDTAKKPAEKEIKIKNNRTMLKKVKVRV